MYRLTEEREKDADKKKNCTGIAGIKSYKTSLPGEKVVKEFHCIKSI